MLLVLWPIDHTTIGLVSTLGKIIPVLLVLLPCIATADSANLEQAEKLFQSGEWDKARAAYAAELAASDPRALPAAFFYNYGTVLAKAGAAGEAYVSLLRAAFAQPFDGDTRVNLLLAERATPAAALSVRPALWLPFWPASLRLWPLQLWLCAALALSAMALAVPKGRLLQVRISLGILAAVLSLASGLVYSQSYLPVSGLVKSAKVRSGPGNSFPEITTLDPGALVNVDGERDGWLKIRFARSESAETVGWLEPSVALPVN
jgi:Bacterial SH3 domain